MNSSLTITPKLTLAALSSWGSEQESPLLLNFIFSYVIHMGEYSACMCVCAHVCAPWRSVEGTGPAGTGVIEGWEPPYRRWEPNLHLPQEHMLSALSPASQESTLLDPVSGIFSTHGCGGLILN